MTHKPALTPAESLLVASEVSGPETTGYSRTSHTIDHFGSPLKYDFFASENPVDTVPILVNNGYCAPAIVYDALAAGLAMNGRHAIRYHPPRHVSLARAVLGGHFANPLKKHAQAAWEVMKDVSAQTGNEVFDVIGHSMGTPISLMLANHKSQAVRSVMCTGGAGLAEAGGIIKMSGQTLDLFRNEILRETEALAQHGSRQELMREIGEHVLSNVPETLAEGFYVSHADVSRDIDRAHEAGIRIGAIIFGQDSYFKPAQVRARVGDKLDYILVVPWAKHLHPQLHPEEHAAEQVSAFNALNGVSIKPKAA